MSNKSVAHILSLSMCLFVTTSYSFARDMMSRDKALEMFEKNAEQVRLHMDSEPLKLRLFLNWNIVGPIGYDSRVINLCSEVIVKSTQAIAKQIAIGSLDSIVRGMTPGVPLNTSKKEKIAIVLQQALEQEDLDLRLIAIGVMKRLGSDYKSKSYDEIIHISKNIKSISARKVQQNLAVRVVEELADYGNIARSTIVQIVRDYELVPYLQNEIALEENSAIKKRWKKLQIQINNLIIKSETP